MNRIIIKDVVIINEGKSVIKDLLIEDKFITQIDDSINPKPGTKEIIGNGKCLIPGIIDDQVHFREPGLTHKADIASESAAAVAGGVTSYMEMPNTNPAATTIKLLEEKYSIAEQTSLANYSFYLGGANDNIEEVKKIDPKKICGLKIFMGSSTGNLLVDDEYALEKLFSNSPTIIAIHSETDKIIENNLRSFFEKYGEDIPIEAHADIRNVEACLSSTQKAIALAKETGAHLHVLHISTEEETKLFDNSINLADKKITSEVCAHHLWFDKDDYQKFGTQIKCNPSIKEKRHKEILIQALLNDRLDVIGSDHAPHTSEEKENKYLRAPSGLPLVQHTLYIFLEFYHQGKISLEKIVEKMCHSPAQLFRIEKRGFIREGYYADLALIDLTTEWIVDKSNIKYKCGWSPFEGNTFHGLVTNTIVSGNHVYTDGEILNSNKGQRLMFSQK